MTRQERLEHYRNAAFNAEHYGREVMVMEHDIDFSARSARHAAHAAGVALDHLAALEQQAITAHLAEVPLPEGWREVTAKSVVAYIENVDGIGPVDRVIAGCHGVQVVTVPAHWPAIPQAILVRAAVQCGKLREGK